MLTKVGGFAREPSYSLIVVEDISDESIQHTRELISAREMSHRHNKKDLSRLRMPDMRVKYKVCINSIRVTSCLCDVCVTSFEC